MAARKCLILVDYANIDWMKIDFFKFICTICKTLNNSIEFLTFRLYGGWFYDENVSDQRLEAIRKVSQWPKLIRIENSIIRISYLFADYLIGYENNEKASIRRTYIERKAKVSGIKIKSDNNLNICSNKNCSIRITRKWLSSLKACVSTNCQKRFNDIFIRYEQKQVDSHILCDFLASIRDESYSNILLMSSDVDLMPGIQVAILSDFCKKIGLIITKRISDDQTHYIECNNITLITNKNGEF